MKPLRIDRRAVLRGVGAGLALPALEAMAPAQSAPVRYIGFLMQNGPPKPWWSPVPIGMPAEPPAGAPNVKTDFGGRVRYYDPAKVGEAYELNVAGRALVPHKADLNLITGLHQRCLFSVFHHSDGAIGCFTGHPMHSKPRDGRPEVGSAPSLEWILGKTVGAQLVHPALYLSLRRDQSQMTNRFYRSSWIADSQPATPIDKPRAFAEKLLPRAPAGTVDLAAAAEARRTRSLLDFVREDASRLQARLGAPDRARLDQHLTSVREIERALEAAERAGVSCAAPPATPEGYLDDDQQMPLMARLIALGMSCDLFRYALFHVQMAWSLPGRAQQDDHSQSHTVTSRDNIYYWDKKMQYLAMLIDELKKTPEGSRTLLYNSVICTGVDVSVGAKHDFNDLPMIVAGQAGGQMKTGRHLHYADVTFNNLYASILNFCGRAAARFGADGTGLLAGLSG